MEGTFRTLNLDRGFGFIRSSGEDYFAHANDLVGLEWNESLLHRIVEFTAQQSDKGRRAVNVKEVR